MKQLIQVLLLVLLLLPIFSCNTAVSNEEKLTELENKKQAAIEDKKRLIKEYTIKQKINEDKLIAQQKLIDSLAPDISKLDKQNKRLDKKLKDLKKLLNNNKNKKLAKEIKELIKKVNEAIKEKQKTISDLANAEKNLLQWKKSYPDALTMLKAQEKELDRAYKLIKTYPQNYPKIESVKAIRFRGKITAINTDALAINGGKNSKLEEGMILTILREGKVICRVKLGTILDNKSFGMIEDRVKGEEPRKGDDVRSLPIGQ